MNPKLKFEHKIGLVVLRLLKTREMLKTKKTQLATE